VESKPGLGSAIAVVVVYQRSWRQVHAGEWLESSLTNAPAPDGSCILPRLGRLLVYDNSAESLGRPAATLPNCDYVHDASNGGTRAAFTRGLELAQRSGLAWVILLDHDTTLSARYFNELDQKFAQLASQSRSAAPPVGLLFPRVVGDSDVLSPAILDRWGTVTPVDLEHDRAITGTLTAVASGTAVRADALAAAGPIPPGLWLDYLDHWLFRKVQQLGYRAECLTSILRHELSIRSAAPLSLARLSNILRAEQLFMSTLGVGARAAYPARLLVRATRMLSRDRRAAWLILRQIAK